MTFQECEKELKQEIKYFNEEVMSNNSSFIFRFKYKKPKNSYSKQVKCELFLIDEIANELRENSIKNEFETFCDNKNKIGEIIVDHIKNKIIFTYLNGKKIKEDFQDRLSDIGNFKFLKTLINELIKFSRQYNYLKILSDTINSYNNLKEFYFLIKYNEQSIKSENKSFIDTKIDLEKQLNILPSNFAIKLYFNNGDVISFERENEFLYIIDSYGECDIIVPELQRNNYESLIKFVFDECIV